MKIAPQVWADAREGARQLREMGDIELAAAVERVIEECIERTHDLARERQIAKRFREDMRARVEALTAKVLVALPPDVAVDVPRRRRGGNRA